VEEGEPGGSPDPERTGRISKDGTHVICGQAVTRRVGSPLAVCQFCQPPGSAKPHGAVGAVFDRGHRVGSQPIRNCVSGKLAIL
jgi:hypothetical protein